MSSGSSGLKSQYRVMSKLRSLFSQTAGHWTDFDIKLDYPHKRYGPGDIVSGTVILDVVRPLGITHIVVSIYGYVQVFKNPSKPKKEPRINGNHPRASKGGRWTTEYYGDGYASLFEEEIVICGVGRLDPDLLHFRFELRFPKGGVIPTSVDFERGTIAYHIQATITRPTAISPTATCDRKIYYRDDIDVSTIEDPKPFVFDLEPVVPTGQRAKSHAKQFASTHAKHKRSSLLSRTDTDFSSRTATSIVTEEEHQSQRRSSTRASSSHSRSSGHMKELEQISDQRSSQQSRTARDSVMTASRKKKISVSIHLAKAACLPGDNIHLTISINHTKPVKSLNGIIVTLYRQSGVDMHPHLPITAKEQNGKSVYEDYYPRSRTGLGGLSLSAAGSSQMWRKDLSQTVKPLIIDPSTLSTEVKLSLSVPEGALETINNVPGEMISFKYHVEVIVDIQGKMSQSGSFPGLGLTANYSNPTTSQMVEKFEDGRQVFTMSEGDCIDTIPIRREKSVMTCIFDLIVGTRDSRRSKGKQREAPITPEEWHERSAIAANATPTLNGHFNDGKGGVEALQGIQNGQNRNYYGYYEYDYDYYNNYGDYEYGHGYESHYYPQTDYDGHDYPTVPSPNLPNDDHLTEKERLQRAEAMLFPSQPPIEDPIASATGDLAPSAPFIAEDYDPLRVGLESEAVQNVNAGRNVNTGFLGQTYSSTPPNAAFSRDLQSSGHSNNIIHTSAGIDMPIVALEADRIATIDHASVANNAADGQPAMVSKTADCILGR